MVVIHNTYSKVGRLFKRVGWGVSIFLGFLFLLFSPSLRVPRFLGGTGADEGVAHADATAFGGTTVGSGGSGDASGGSSGDGTGS